MSKNFESLDKLINSFSKLPAVGAKTAQRYAYSVIQMTEYEVNEFAQNLLNVKKQVKFCEICGNWTDKNICDICSSRKSNIVCVVAEPKDIVAFEKVRDFNGTYHVLHGTLSPLNHKGPNDIRIKELFERIKKGNINEVIMATNPDVEGEATAMYVASLLKPLNIKVTRLAQGISMGSALEFADEVTLTRALEDRKDM